MLTQYPNLPNSRHYPLHNTLQNDSMLDVDYTGQDHVVHHHQAQQVVHHTAPIDRPVQVPRVAHQEYSYRLPTEPRIIVPPPTLTSELPDLEFDTTHSHVNTSFLGNLSLANVLQQNTLLEWSYERRRSAQMVLPMLYLGPMVAARDAKFIRTEGITMALAVRSHASSMRGVMQAAQQLGLEVGTVEAASPSDLPRSFPVATSTINNHLNKAHGSALLTGSRTPGKVLVFCESGNEKSAAVVAAYLMVTLNNCDHIKAMQICQTQRFCVNFDDTSKQVLRSYWDIVQAQRCVTSSLPESFEKDKKVAPDSSPQQVRHKRGIDDTEPDDDVDMGRSRNLTPFMDDE